MPFTVSHVAAVLPVVGRSGRLPAAAMVIGSMVPDYPWFLTRGRTAGLSHSVLGLVTVDLVIGVIAVVVWRRWAQAPVRDLVPRAVGERLPQPPGLAVRDLPWVGLGVLVGALTHLVWDSFTHAGRWGVEVVPWLHTDHLGLTGFRWAQYASGLLGLLVLLVWGLRWLGAAAPDDDGLRSTGSDRRTAWSLVAAGAALGMLAGLLRPAGSAEVALFGAVTFGGAGLAVGVVLACTLWWTRVSRPAEMLGRRG
jgi:hypothetical protein